MGSVRAWVSKSRRIWSRSSPKVKLSQPSVKHRARNRGGDFLTPKLLILMILAKFIWCMLILSLEINLGEIGVKVEKLEHGTELG